MGRIKKEIKKLMNKIDTNVEDPEERDFQKDMIYELAEDCADYIRAISNMENAINIARFTIEGEEYRETISNLDNLRRRSHNAVIVNTKVLNRLCALYSMPPIYKGDINDRIAISNFAKEYIDELYDERRI